MTVNILHIPICKWRRKLKKRRARKRWEAQRFRLMFLASNGAHFPKSVRENYKMPDWTG